jgi:hypothetical protein
MKPVNVVAAITAVLICVACGAADEARPPRTLIWVGPPGGRWSVPTHWSPAGLPGDDDDVVFDGALANADSIMDLGNGHFYHVRRVRVRNDYEATIRIQGDLFTDVLRMGSTATISGGSLNVWQRTNDRALPPAGAFESSSWTAGTITSDLNLYGESVHHLTFRLGGRGTPSIQGDFAIRDRFGTVNWLEGNVTVAPGKVVTNNGTFLTDSPGFMGNAARAAGGWDFRNNGDWMVGDSRLNNVSIKGNGRRFVRVP